MRKFKVTASSNSSTLKVTPYVINKGQSGEYYGLKNAEDNQVLTSAPNNWKSKKGAIAWAKKKGYEVVESACGKKSVKATHYKAKPGGWNYDNPETNKFIFLYKHRWYTGYKTFDECLADVIDTVGIDNIISEGVEISKENSAGYSVERWDSSEVYEAANDASIARNKKSVKANTAKRRKSVKASKVDGDDMTLAFITPDLSAASMVAEKAWEIGGFGSTWSEHSWVYIDVPATQSIDNIEELIDYAQNNGAYLNLKSSNELDKWLGLVDAACGKKSVKASYDDGFADMLHSVRYHLRFNKGADLIFDNRTISSNKRDIGHLLDKYNVDDVIVDVNRDRAGKRDLQRMQDLGFEIQNEFLGETPSNPELPPHDVYRMVRNKKSVKASKKFDVKASKSARRRKAIKASFDENGFAVTGYLGSNRSGAYADRYFGSDEWSEVESYAHELLMQGLYVNIVYFKTGDQINIDPDVYAENFDGEFVVTNEIADFRDKVWKSMGIGASTKRRNGTKVTAAWYEGGDIVMYFNGEKIYEGQPGADMYDAILPLCQDDETRLKFQEWCNQFGDPLFDDEYGDASETAYTFCELIYYDFVDDENNYEDGDGILDFEIFPATEEVTGAESVKCASENISAAEYNQMLADMTLGILHDDGYEGIGCAVTDEALSFYDGTEDDVVYIQPTDEITPILGDEDADAEELAAAVKSVAGKAVEAATYEDLEPINGDDSKYGYTSNGDPIDESTVDELYRIAEREVLPTTELAKVDEYATIMEDTFEYYASSPYVGVTYTISATFDTDDIDVVSYALPDAFHYDFRGGKEVGELEFYIYVKGNEIDKVELIWNSSNLDPNNYDMEAIEEYVKGIAKPAAEAIYNAITNI